MGRYRYSNYPVSSVELAGQAQLRCEGPAKKTKILGKDGWVGGRGGGGGGLGSATLSAARMHGAHYAAVQRAEDLQYTRTLKALAASS